MEFSESLYYTEKKIGLEKNPLRTKKFGGSKSGISRRKIKYSYIFFKIVNLVFYVVVSEMVRNGSRTRVITEKPVKVKKVDMHIFYNAHISFSRT